MTTRRRPFAFVESWPFVLLMLFVSVAVAHCQHDGEPAAAPAAAQIAEASTP